MIERILINILSFIIAFLVSRLLLRLALKYLNYKKEGKEAKKAMQRSVARIKAVKAPEIEINLNEVAKDPENNMQKATEALASVGISTEQAEKYIKLMIKTFSEVSALMDPEVKQLKKWQHYANHAKKFRVRKKYKNKIARRYGKEATNENQQE